MRGSQNRLKETSRKLPAEAGGRWGPDHGGRPTGRWAPPAPLCSGGLPCVSFLLSHVSKFLVCRLGAACGSFDPCEPKFCALIGRQFFPWINKALLTYTLVPFSIFAYF